jgi:4-amino-4-deoxychorismate lyase
MFQFIESIRLEEGRTPFLSWHQKRVNNTLAHFNYKQELSLSGLIEGKQLPLTGLHKIRIVYGAEGVCRFEATPYAVKPIFRIAMMEVPDSVGYEFKFEDRRWISHLLALADTDDIILHRKGEVLEASYANLVFKFGDQWVTPNAPLLTGTCRARLLSEGKIKTATIAVSDLLCCQEMKWINSMMIWDESPIIKQKELQEMIRV